MVPHAHRAGDDRLAWKSRHGFLRGEVAGCAGENRVLVLSVKARAGCKDLCRADISCVFAGE